MSTATELEMSEGSTFYTVKNICILIFISFKKLNKLEKLIN